MFVGLQKSISVCALRYFLSLFKMQYVQNVYQLSVFGGFCMFTRGDGVSLHTELRLEALAPQDFQTFLKHRFYLLFVDYTLIWITASQTPFSKRINVVWLHGCLLVC